MSKATMTIPRRPSSLVIRKTVGTSRSRFPTNQLDRPRETVLPSTTKSDVPSSDVGPSFPPKSGTVGVTWPRVNRIPPLSGVSSTSLCDLTTATRVEQQTFHQAAWRRLREILGTGSAVRKHARHIPSLALPDLLKQNHGTALDSTRITAPHLEGPTSHQRYTQALQLAQLLLQSPHPSLHPSRASTSAEPLDPQRARKILYSRLIHVFCLANHPRVALSLLQRRKAEGIEVRSRDVTMIMSALAGEYSRANSGDGRNEKGKARAIDEMMVLQKVLPFFPDRPDEILLTQAVRIMMKNRDMRPEEVREIIDRCLNTLRTGLQNRQTEIGTETGEEDRQATEEQEHGMLQWEWGLWDTYMGSFRAERDWRSAMIHLGEFARVVQRAAERRMSQPRRHSAPTNTDDSEVTKGHSSADPIWSENELAQIRRPFITVLSIYTDYLAALPGARPARHNRRTPRTIIDLYLSLVHSDGEPYRGGSAPISNPTCETDRTPSSTCRLELMGLEMTNAWLNVERIIGAVPRAEAIWGAVSGSTLQGSPVDEAEVAKYIGPFLPEDGRLPRLCFGTGPDEHTYRAMFKLLKKANVGLTEGMVHKVIDSGMIYRPGVLDGAFSALLHADEKDDGIAECDISAQTSKIRLTKRLLETTLSPADLGSITETSTLSKRPTAARARLTARTVDIIASGLIKLWRSGAPLFPDTPVLTGISPTAPHLCSFQSRTSPSSFYSSPSPSPSLPLRSAISSSENHHAHPIQTGEDGLPFWVSRREWDMMTDTLHAIRFANRQAGEVVKRINLPLGRPTGELMDSRRIVGGDGPRYGGEGVPVGVRSDTSVVLAGPKGIEVAAGRLAEPLRVLLERVLQQMEGEGSCD